jgi:1-acyl-sn-glycerol-3-phosphate acyltransferase
MKPDHINFQPYTEEGLAEHIEMALSVKSPTGPILTVIHQLIKRVFTPTLIGCEKIPEKPCLFISNHSLFALDGLVLLPIINKQLGRFARTMSDKFLWSPATETALLNFGVVLGDPSVCDALMKDNQDILLFPGGAHEAVKRSAERYQLKWKQRHGFVRLAAQHGYTIVPLAQVGPDDFYNHLIEGEDLANSYIGKLLNRLGILTEQTRSDMIPPVPIGLLGSLIPKPQHCYYQFGDPIDLSKYKGKKLSQQKMHSIRTEVSDQLEAMLEQLLEKREAEKDQAGLLRRLLTL